MTNEKKAFRDFVKSLGFPCVCTKKYVVITCTKKGIPFESHKALDRKMKEIATKESYRETETIYDFTVYFQ